MRPALALAALAASALALGAEPAAATNECRGLQVCVPVAGPWVVVPARGGVPRRGVEYQLACPRRYVVAGLDAELSVREIDVSFLGKLGTPVNPGITTSRTAVFAATYVGGSGRAATFRPHIGCIPASGGGGGRVPTAVSAFPPGAPTVWRVRTVRLRPGRTERVVRRCAAGERVVGASHAIGFARNAPPEAALIAAVSASRALRGGRVVATVRTAAAAHGARALIQVQAVCAGGR